MKWKKAFICFLALLCVLTAVLLARAAVGLYLEGEQLREGGNALTPVYTREKVAERLIPLAPLVFAAAGLAVLGLLLNVRDESGARLRPGSLPPSMPGKSAKQSPGRKTNAFRAAMLFLSAALITAGILNGGLWDVLQKAAAICTECIGLG